MAFKIWKIALLVDDTAAAERLYVDTLGMTVLDRLDLSSMGVAGEAVFLDGGGVQLELIPTAAFAGAPDRLTQPGVHHISFKADDVAATQAALQAQGVAFIKEAFSPLPGMTLAFFEGGAGVNLQLFNQQ